MIRILEFQAILERLNHAGTEGTEMKMKEKMQIA